MKNNQHAYILNGPFYFHTTHAEEFLLILATDYIRKYSISRDVEMASTESFKRDRAWLLCVYRQLFLRPQTVRHRYIDCQYHESQQRPGFTIARRSSYRLYVMFISSTASSASDRTL
jgi:hypothetical protein